MCLEGGEMFLEHFVYAADLPLDVAERMGKVLNSVRDRKLMHIFGFGRVKKMQEDLGALSRIIGDHILAVVISPFHLTLDGFKQVVDNG